MNLCKVKGDYAICDGISGYIMMCNATCHGNYEDCDYSDISEFSECIYDSLGICTCAEANDDRIRQIKKGNRS